jgi:threonine dehydratase
MLTLDSVDSFAAARRLEGVVRETPLAPFPSGDPRVDLRLKLECLQEINAFKSRGAWNQVSQLTPAERERGVVATSSGNHAKALAWAASRAGVRCTVFMPADAYPNKVQACRDAGAEVVLGATREDCERLCRERVAAGAVLVHPYDALRTIEGAGTVGVEVARQWPHVEVVVVPCGGGGLVSGIAIALRRAFGPRVRVIGVEPAGAPKMTRALAEGAPVTLTTMTTKVQGLCPPAVGALTLEAVRRHVDRVVTIEDAPVFDAQRRLVREGGWTVEPAGAAGAALVLAGGLPTEWLAGRTAQDPLRVVAVVSGGNPDPAQLEALRRD